MSPAPEKLNSGALQGLHKTHMQPSQAPIESAFVLVDMGLHELCRVCGVYCRRWLTIRAFPTKHSGVTNPGFTVLQTSNTTIHFFAGL